VELHRQAPSCSRRTDATAILASFEDPYEALLPSMVRESDLAGLRRLADELGERMSPHLVDTSETRPSA
jgi:hypothetical protein